MRIGNFCFRQSGFSVIEVILASAVFLILSSGAISVVLQGFDANRLGSEETVANQYASEGIEAARSIGNRDYTKLVDTNGTGVIRTGAGLWDFSGVNNTFGKYTRVIKIEDVCRNGSGDIVACPGTSPDPDTKKVTSTVTWQFSPARNDSVVLDTYLTNWRPSHGGMLVYSDGGSTSNSIKYKILSSSTGAWSPAAQITTMPPGSGSQYVVRAELFASATRNEKILLTKNADANSHYIYAQVFDGSTWGNLVLLASGTPNGQTQNFSGTYLADGDFMAVFSNWSTTPQFAIWHKATGWSGVQPMQTLNGYPGWVVVSARPGTNEVMAAITTVNNNTETEYFDGNITNPTSTDWTVTQHATVGESTATLVDFAWSPNNPLKGALVYTDANPAYQIATRIWTTVSGGGSGSWSSRVESPALPSSAEVGVVSITSRTGVGEFMSCAKGKPPASSVLQCYTISPNSITPVWNVPVSPGVNATSTFDTYLSYDSAYQPLTSTQGFIVYSDNTNTPRLKKYAATSLTWDTTTTNITPNLSAVMQSVQVFPLANSNDSMVVLSDMSENLYTIVWDGTNNSFYTAPAGKALYIHGNDAGAVNPYFYSFAWDQY